MTSAIGKHIADYVLVSQLWEMCLGTVYQARHLGTENDLTILLLHSDLNQQIPIRQHFVQSVREADILDHPSILKLHKAGEINGRFYVTMPSIEGVSLGEKMQSWLKSNQTIQLEEALLLMAQIAEAVAHAHQQNIYHKALNPYSIIVKRQPQAAGFPLRAILYDIGFGKLEHALLEIPTDRQKRTLPYYSPEQTIGQRVDLRTDIYAIGVILYQLLTSHHPFPIDEAADAVQLHLHETPPTPTDVQPDIPKMVETIIIKAMHKDPEKRYQTGTVVAAALRNAALQLANQPTATLRNNVVSLRTRLPAAEIDRLFIFGQDETARIYPLDKRVVIIGRSRTSDIRLPAEGISRHHIRLEQKEEGWNIIDLKTTNGSMMDNEKLASNVPHHWAKNQPLHIGPYVLKWR